MASEAVSVGDTIMVALPSHDPHGREQEGTRPAVVVGVPTGTVRYPVAVIVPLTTQVGSWSFNNPALYPRLKAGAGGLPRDSTALLDQIRGLDVQRIAKYLGTLSQDEFEPIRSGLRELLGLRDTNEAD